MRLDTCEAEQSLSERYETMSQIYLAMWSQLDAVASENKWLDLRPENGADLSQEIQALYAPFQSDPQVKADFERAQQYLLERGSPSELQRFSGYLRDTGLRYAELSVLKAVSVGSRANRQGTITSNSPFLRSLKYCSSHPS